MRLDCALLCDAATVREGLLHILGGGIARANRETFPAPLNMMLAVRVMVHPTELARPHALELILNDSDGITVAKRDVSFGVSDPSQVPMGEEASIVMPLPFQGVLIPRAGAYAFEILIDGTHFATVPFTAVTTAAPSPY